MIGYQSNDEDDDDDDDDHVDDDDDDDNDDKKYSFGNHLIISGRNGSQSIWEE